MEKWSSHLSDVSCLLCPSALIQKELLFHSFSSGSLNFLVSLAVNLFSFVIVVHKSEMWGFLFDCFQSVGETFMVYLKKRSKECWNGMNAALLLDLYWILQFQTNQKLLVGVKILVRRKARG